MEKGGVGWGGDVNVQWHADREVRGAGWGWGC